ncbi:MAG: DUF3761 domain-containing protein [Dokdonella sp.]
MNNLNVLRLAAFATILGLAAASSVAMAAEGSTCTTRVAGPQGASGATIGHLDAGGKCVTKDAAPKEKSGNGLEASAQCKDLSFSYNPRREAACAKHGGVMEWLAQQ